MIVSYESLKLGAAVPCKDNYLFIDFETANNAGDICQAGAIAISNGIIVDIIDELVRPIHSITNDPYHFGKHGIKNEDVKESNTFDIVWNNRLLRYLQDYIWVFHGQISADPLFIDTDLSHYNICPNCEMKYYSTYSNAPAGWRCSAEEYRSKLGWVPQKAHSALSDALDCLNFFLHQQEMQDIQISTYRFGKHLRNVPQNAEKTFIPFSGSRLTKIEKNNITVNKERDKDFDGKIIVISGTFRKYPDESRKELEAEIQKRGGKCRNSISPKTNMFIYGSNFGPSKMTKAKEQCSLRNNIQLVNEETLYKMLESNEPIE